jgi:hypothetical protein
MLAQASISVPSTEKCSLDRSMRTCGRFSTLAGNVAVKQPISILAEYRGMPHLIVRRQANEPTEQQIVVELLDWKPRIMLKEGLASTIAYFDELLSDQSCERSSSKIPRFDGIPVRAGCGRTILSLALSTCNHL